MSSWTDGYLEINGITMHYTRSGANKQQVVLCHGFSDNGLCWTALAKQLEADYDVIMVDARCHGKSDAPETGNDTSAMRDVCQGQLLGEKDRARAHSRGGAPHPLCRAGGVQASV